MKKDSDILENCPLFAGIEKKEMEELLLCLCAQSLEADRGQTIFLEGEPAKYVGIVVSGCVQIVREDYYGNRSILASAGQGELFGEVFACAGVEKLPVSVIASEKSRILLTDCKRIITTCKQSCTFHSRIIQNLLRIVASKNLILNQKIECTSRRTTREKLMAYLMIQAREHNSSSFTIPFDRQSLADYLCVDRSAMSAEISRLQKEGVLKCRKSEFRLL